MHMKNKKTFSKVLKKDPKNNYIVDSFGVFISTNPSSYWCLDLQLRNYAAFSFASLLFKMTLHKERFIILLALHLVVNLFALQIGNSSTPTTEIFSPKD